MLLVALCLFAKIALSKMILLTNYKTMSEEKTQEITAEEAMKILEQAEKVKLEKFSKKINELLEEYGYRFDVVSQINIIKK